MLLQICIQIPMVNPFFISELYLHCLAYVNSSPVLIIGHFIDIEPWFIDLQTEKIGFPQKLAQCNGFRSLWLVANKRILNLIRWIQFIQSEKKEKKKTGLDLAGNEERPMQTIDSTLIRKI